MPANEFEKQVQQKIGDLKFTPSEEVWKEVEHRIRKEKKKRRIFFWLFLLLGGGLAAGIWLTSNNENKIAQSGREVNKLQPNHPATQKQSETDASFLKDNAGKKIVEKNKLPKENNDNQEKKSFQKDQQVIKNKGTELTQFVRKAEIHRDIIVKNKRGKQGKADIVTGNDHADQQKNNIVSKDVTVKEENNEPKIKKQKFGEIINDSTVTAKDQKNDIVSKDIPLNKKNNEPKIQKQDSSEITNDSTVIAANQKRQAIKLSKKTKKWQWGVIVGKGKSYTAKGLKFSDNKSISDNLYANPSQGTANPVYVPSAIHPSGSFAAGIFIKRSVSSGFDVNFSLGYLYLSTKMNVGSRMDSSFVISNSLSSSLTVDNFYRVSNNNSSYTNRYHFLSFSAELSWKIVDRKKFSLYWNNGFSYNRLLSSNALHFDRNLPGYYKDFRLLTHNHFFFSTGLSIPVFKRFEINPFAEYSLTPVLHIRSDSLQLPHFTNYGIRIKILLKNKK